VLPPERIEEVTHLLAHLCGYPFPDSPVVQALANVASQLEIRTFVALRRFLAADSARIPLLLILDEVERAHDATVNLIHFLAAGLRDAPLMLLCLGRPEMFEVHARFNGVEPPSERLTLEPLSEEEALVLFDALMRTVGPVPDLLKTHVREKLAGSPRAIHEFARFLVEAGVIQPTPAGWRLDRALLRATRLPERPSELPQARLAMLDEGERMLLQKASVMGEAFWLDAVVALVRSHHGSPDPDGPTLAEMAAAGERTRVAVAETFARLARRGWVVESPRSSIAGEFEYHFAYAPLWEIIYDTIPREARAADHRLMAQWLSLTPEGRTEHREREVAGHLERGGDMAGAAHHYRRAAEVARAMYQNERAIELYRLALRCLGGSHVAARLITWHDLGSVCQMVGDHEQALAAFERMLRLSWVLASRAKAAVALNKMGRVWREKGDLRIALEYLERGLELFQRAADERGVAASLDDIGQVLWLLDRYEEAMERSLTALEMRRRIGDRRSIASSLVNVGNIHRELGRLQEAEECYREALEHHREVGDKPGEAETLAALGTVAFGRDEIEIALTFLNQGLRLASQIGAVPTEVTLRIRLGEVLLMQDRVPEARKHLEEALTLAQEIADRRQQSEAASLLSRVALAQGRLQEAQQLARRALELAEPAGFRLETAQALLAVAEVRARSESLSLRASGLRAPLGDSASATPAETYFVRAVDIFREVGHALELARALERHGRHRLGRGDAENARAFLSEAASLYERVGSGRATQLRTLLASLDAGKLPGSPLGSSEGGSSPGTPLSSSGSSPGTPLSSSGSSPGMPVPSSGSSPGTPMPTSSGSSPGMPIPGGSSPGTEGGTPPRSAG